MCTIVSKFGNKFLKFDNMLLSFLLLGFAIIVGGQEQNVTEDGSDSTDVAITEEGSAPEVSTDVAVTEEGSAPEVSTDVAVTEEGSAPDVSTDVAVTEEGSAPEVSTDVADTDDGVPTQTSAYSSLELNTQLLKGSRWSIDQIKMKRRIVVYHAVQLVDITKVDVDTMSIRMEIHFQQRWNAPNLKLPEGLFEPGDAPDTFINVNAEILKSIWSPNPYISTARETTIASFIQEDSQVEIFQNRTIIYKARLSTVLGCSFDFRWYPLDKQSCNLNIESYTDTNETVRYVWEPKTAQIPVINTKVTLYQYDLVIPMAYTNGTSQRWGRKGNYPYVQLIFQFERQLGHHMIQVFIPTTLVVILSWFSFWFGLDAVPARTTLLITAMLTLVTMHAGLSNSLPPVNYVKMMDIWIVGCITFVFLALCEFVVVKFLYWRNEQELKAIADKEKETKKNEQIDERIHNEKADRVANDTQPLNPYIEFYRNMRVGPLDFYKPSGNGQFIISNVGGVRQTQNLASSNEQPIWVTIDTISRSLFPMSFVVFNAVYWPWLLVGSENQ